MLMALRDSLQKNFIVTLRDLKNIDSEDLLKKRKEGKAESTQLKSLTEFVNKDTEGKVTIDE